MFYQQLLFQPNKLVVTNESAFAYICLKSRTLFLNKDPLFQKSNQKLFRHSNSNSQLKSTLCVNFIYGWMWALFAFLTSLVFCQLHQGQHPWASLDRLR